MANDVTEIKNLKRLLEWTNSFETGMVLVSNSLHIDKYKYSGFELMAATGIEDCLHFQEEKDFFEELKFFSDKYDDWIFGHFCYDLKNQVENLNSGNPDHINFPDGFFFVPQNIIQYKDGKEIIIKQKDESWVEFELNHKKNNILKHDKILKSRLTQNEYIDTIKRIKEHIHRGDIFEVNYCFEYYLSGAVIDPVDVFLTINQLSPMPFAGFYKLKNKYLLCFSPERFLKKTGSKIISQPMKGTVKRGLTKKEDKKLRDFLKNDVKERTENIMITDLVRNDLSRTAKNDSVHVEELCAVYGFKQVFQMISTISAELDQKIHYADSIRNSFPMGSMTGAPKVSAMELIEKYEKTKRNLYSGSIGYVTPEKDFDFNVVIRSICYNENQKYLNFMVGSAITSMSVPEMEYEECRLKAKALYDWLIKNY